MMKELKLITMKNTKKELYNAGRENYFQYIRLLEENDRMRVNLASTLNTLKFILSRMPQIAFAYDDDGLEDEVEENPKGDNPGIEVA